MRRERGRERRREAEREGQREAEKGIVGDGERGEGDGGRGKGERHRDRERQSEAEIFWRKLGKKRGFPLSAQAQKEISGDRVGQEEAGGSGKSSGGSGTPGIAS